MLSKRTRNTLLYAGLAVGLSGCGGSYEKLVKRYTRTKRTYSQNYLNKKVRAAERFDNMKEFHNKSVKDMTAMNTSELIAAKDAALKVGYVDTAIKYLEYVIAQEDDPTIGKEARLQIANLYFDQGRLNKAERHYAQYLLLYPGSEQYDEVQYKAILSQFYATLESDRDQSKTEATLAMSDAFLGKKVDPNLRKEVDHIRNTCINKLVEHEAGVFDFYLNKSAFDQAERRLAHMKKEYLPKETAFEPRFMELDCKLALAQKKHGEFVEKARTILTQNPKYAFNDQRVIDAIQSNKELAAVYTPPHPERRLARAGKRDYVSLF